MDNVIEMNHGIIAENRKKLNVSGVKEVISFDEETIQLDTVQGKLTVKGEQLHILSFHTESGDLSAEGRLHALVYVSDEKSGGFFGRLFR